MALPAEIVEALSSRLGALDGEPTALDGGITNRNFRARFGESEVVVRLPGKDTAALGIDRAEEAEANSVAAAGGIAPEVVALLDEPPALVTAFLEGETMDAERLREPAAVLEAASVLRRVHECEAVAASFSSFRVVETYAERTRARGGTVPAGYERSRPTAAKIEAAFRHRPHEPVLCHNDLLAANWIRTPEGLRIVDWEYAGMGDRYFDLGNFAANQELEPEAEEAMLEVYLGEPPTLGQLATLRLMRFMAGYFEAMWGVLQATISELEFDFLAYAEKSFEQMAAREADPHFKVLLQEAGGAPV